MRTPQIVDQTLAVVQFFRNIAQSPEMAAWARTWLRANDHRLPCRLARSAVRRLDGLLLGKEIRAAFNPARWW